MRDVWFSYFCTKEPKVAGCDMNWLIRQIYYELQLNKLWINNYDQVQSFKSIDNQLAKLRRRAWYNLPSPLLRGKGCENTTWEKKSKVKAYGKYTGKLGENVKNSSWKKSFSISSLVLSHACLVFHFKASWRNRVSRKTLQPIVGQQWPSVKTSFFFFF